MSISEWNTDLLHTNSALTPIHALMQFLVSRHDLSPRERETLRSVPVEAPAAAPVTLTDIHGFRGFRDTLVLEWSDYTSIPQGQPPTSLFALKRMQLWQDGATEPLVNIRGMIEALSESQALVTRTAAGEPDTPSLFLVTYR